MDVPKLSMALSGVKVAQSVNISMMKKAMEMTEQQGQQLAEMMDAMARVIDVRV